MKNNYIKFHTLPQIRFAHIYSGNNYTAKLEANANHIEITYIHSGVLHCEQDGKRYEAKSGFVISNIYNELLNIGSTGHHEHHTVCFVGPFEISDADSEGALCLPLCVDPGQEKKQITALIDEIIHGFTLHTGNDAVFTGLFLQLLGTIDSVAREPVNKQSYGNLRYVRYAKEYIFQNLTKPIRQSDIASHLGITPEYLCTIFRKVEGTTPIQFINRIKLEKIASLVERDHVTLARASEIYGYNDPNYVSRLYKKYFHMNITDIKKSRYLE